MPSFDIVSKVDEHELTNAVDQANREVDNRFDFKGSGAKFELKDLVVNLTAPSDFQVKQMGDILTGKISKRGIDVRCLEFGEILTNLSEARQEVKVKNGISKEEAKKVTKFIKDQKLKVQASIQGEQVRVTGKKRDDLQETIAAVKDSKLDLPLQFENFRD
jgi:uncharacterized protein YajQ (UPF0234 family)